MTATELRRAPPGWHWATLESASVGVFDCPHSTPKLAEHGPVLVRTQDIRTGRLRVEDAVRVSEETYRERVARAVPMAGDILYSREGTYFGDAAEVPADTRVCLGQRMVLIRPKPTVMSARYLRFWLNSPILKAHILGFRDGSVAERLNLPVIRSLPVLLPPLHHQEAIARILGALDDKIELNRRTNETLEAMARAIFQSWFVDFDPVRAKMEGRQPQGMDAETAKLFPSNFVPGDRGRVPQGWAHGSLLDIATVLSGGTPRTDRADYWGGDIAWASAKDVSQCPGHFLTDTERTITALGLDESATQLVPALSTAVVARGATTGRLAVMGATMAMNQTCYAFVSLQGAPHYLSSVLHHEIPNLVKAAHGSVFDTITTRTIAGSSITVPPIPLMRAFDQTVGPLWRSVLSATHESRTLAATRDALLPKLLSGELRVPDAERAVAAVL